MLFEGQKAARVAGASFLPTGERAGGMSPVFVITDMTLLHEDRRRGTTLRWRLQLLPSALVTGVLFKLKCQENYLCGNKMQCVIGDI